MSAAAKGKSWTMSELKHFLRAQIVFVAVALLLCVLALPAFGQNIAGEAREPGEFQYRSQSGRSCRR